MPPVIYFDHNATTPLLPEARRAWLEACDLFPGNPSSPHRLGARAEHALNEARFQLAARLGCNETEIVFTSGATESNNTVLHHVACIAPADVEVWVSAIEHPCLLAPAQNFFGSRLRLIPVSRAGGVDLDWLAGELNHRRPALVAIMAANNETGALQPWREAHELCHTSGVPFLCDAVQWLGRLPARGLGACDWVTGSAHKFGGPRGVGFLKVPTGKTITPLLRGGEQESDRRSGTENLPGVCSMLAALQVREEQIARREHEPLAGERDDFERKLLQVLPGSEIVAASSPRLWNTVSALMPEADCQQRWVVKLDRQGFAVSTGSACASGKEKPSHVLQAMGFSSAEAARALRFSAGWETPVEDWAALRKGLETIQDQILRAVRK